MREEQKPQEGLASLRSLIHVKENALVRLQDGRIGVKTTVGREHYVTCDAGERVQRSYDELVEVVADPSEIAVKCVSSLALLEQIYRLLREDPAPRTEEWIHSKWELLANTETTLHIPKAQWSRSTAWLLEEKNPT